MAAGASQKFYQALKESHNPIHQMVATKGGTSMTIDYLDASLTQSYDDTSRWSMDCTLLTPSNYSVDGFKAFLNTRLTTLQPWRGIAFFDGTQEMINFAKFYITDIVVDRKSYAYPVLKVQAFDRSCRAQGDIGTTVGISLGSDPSLIVPQILARRIPHATYALARTPYRTPYLVLTPDQDAWSEAQRLMASVGQSIYFDRNDRCVSSARALAPSTEYVWHYNSQVLSDFANTTRHASNDLFPNVVNVVSTNPATPNVVGQAADNNPDSATYRYGDYGEQPVTYRSEQVTTTAQANAMAQYLLSRLLGPQDEITFEAVPNPILDVGDTIRITDPDEGLNAMPLLVTNLKMPLTTDGIMEVTARPSLFSNITTIPPRS